MYKCKSNNKNNVGQRLEWTLDESAIIVRPKEEDNI